MGTSKDILHDKIYELEEELTKYKKAYEIFMEFYFDLHENDKKELNQKLNKIF